MRPFLVWGLLLIFVCGVVGPPVTEPKKKPKNDKESAENNEIEDQALEVEYQRYLQEVVNTLEMDEGFKASLTQADANDIKSGKIATDLELVNHNIRSKLDELKRQELERLRQAAMRQNEHENGIDRRHNNIKIPRIPAHLDPHNPHTFEAEDLRKLIFQTTKDLEDMDRSRKKEFKEYEMQKELEYQEKLKKMGKHDRSQAEKKHQEMVEKHKNHKPLHHPGSKDQLEEVWEEQDHLSPEEFNPKTFFHLHDLDGNGFWDANEVKTLFRKELDKMYEANAPEDDIKERMEEMERMREHVFNETDTNKDQLISYQEFYDQTKRQEFERDEGWEPLDQQQQYTPEEYQQYAGAHEKEVRKMIEQGVHKPPPGHPQNPIPSHDPEQFQQHQAYQEQQGQRYPPHVGAAPVHPAYPQHPNAQPANHQPPLEQLNPNQARHHVPGEKDEHPSPPRGTH